MPLQCTLARGPLAATHGPPKELTIHLPEGTPGRKLAALLADTHGTGRIHVAGEDLRTLVVGVPPLVNGSVLVDGGQGGHAQASPPAMLLVAHSGPAAGAMYPVLRGRNLIGRGTAHISVPDPDISREHAALDVSFADLTLTRLPANRSPEPNCRPATPEPSLMIDGKPTNLGPVNTSSTIQCGNSIFSLLASKAPVPLPGTEAGCSVHQPLEVHRPTGGGNRWAGLVTGLLPLLLGVGLALATGSWMFLGFTAISAVSLSVAAFSGRQARREFRRALGQAVSEDIKRRNRSSPSAAGIATAILLETPRPPASAAGPGDSACGAAAPADSEGRALARVAKPGSGGPRTSGIWLRLGLASVPANIRLLPEDPQFRPPTLAGVPLTLPPSAGQIPVTGDPLHFAGLVRLMLMQLAAYPAAVGVPVIILGSGANVPLAARFLKDCLVAATSEAALAGLHACSGRLPGRLFVFNAPPAGSSGVEALVEAAVRADWQVVRHERAHPAGSSAWTIDMDPSGISATLGSPGARQRFIPDLVTEPVFDRFCRALSARQATSAEGGPHLLPDECSLEEIVPRGPRSLASRWHKNSGSGTLKAVLGKDGHGPVAFDFLMDGPHLLVAGTTGAGKSELLRTLSLSLAMNYPPQELVFLFIDFKGGSGLGPLERLPHCAGLVTDLGGQGMKRVLESLRSEIRYREEAFHAGGVADIKDYRPPASGSVGPIPRLVLVIDEFRMLVDEEPAALRELMRIAAVGRSLGLHLVMATQRPQGALTADIRANVTTSIALRVQSEAESTDIIKTGVAAGIPVRLPGRAFLARAFGAPEEFQSASVLVAHRGHLDETCVQPALDGPDTRDGDDSDAWEEAASGSDNPGVGRNTPQRAPRGSLAEQGLPAFVAMIRAAATTMGAGSAPRRIIAPPLPAEIPWDPGPATCDGVTAAPKDVHSEHGTGHGIGLGLVDRPGSQTVELLSWTPSVHGHFAMIGSTGSGMPEAFRAVSARIVTTDPTVHSYILDATGTFQGLPESDRYGAVAHLHQLAFAVRVLERIKSFMADRRSSSDGPVASQGILLIIAGWCTWVSAIRNSPYAWAEDVLRDIVRDGTPLGVTVLICGERELVSSRFFATIPNRAFFPAGATEESTFHWPKLPPVDPLPGRAVALGSFVQGKSAVAQFQNTPGGKDWPYGPLAAKSPAPLRLQPLPAFLGTKELPEQPPTCGDAVSAAWFGVGGDDAAPLAIPLRRGGITLVLGGPGSGKTSLLRTLMSVNSAVPWLSPVENVGDGAFWTDLAEAASLGALDKDTVLLVDNADTLNPQARQSLAGLAGSVGAIVMTATTSPTLLHRLPFAEVVQATRSGLVLSPRTPLDGDVFGVRLNVESSVPPAGRGILIQGASQIPFQAAYAGGRFEGRA
ncbi:cell division protein FtsK [Arthrobacter sp. TES]|uniref:FtsK/SpoIIIE domain-containing protein n=1 Tax=Paenarthrobacter ureafaciens TaxID=37931 RepID=UPI00039643C6|nr:FtsK/SpoIIIE domain-containing protein [Paenarthrobacter ureafaciens]QOI62765.1 cell division protein FtsK [Arthrobacter sp. TES]